MIDNDHIFVFDYPFDIEHLRSKMDESFSKMEKLDPSDKKERMWGVYNPSFSYINKLKLKFKINFYPMFLYTEKNSTIDLHVDDVSECSILINLNKDTQSPITYVNDDGSYINYNYKQCLVNGKKEHAVFNCKENRYVLKLCIDDIPFNEAKLHIKKVLEN